VFECESADASVEPLWTIIWRGASDGPVDFAEQFLLGVVADRTEHYRTAIDSIGAILVNDLARLQVELAKIRTTRRQKS
jgi:hypothetical protein